MQLDDRLRHLGLPDVEVDDDAALAATQLRVRVRRRRRKLIGSFGAVMLLVGVVAGAVVLAPSGDRQSQVATVGPPKRYLPAVVPQDLELTTVDEAPNGVAGKTIEDGPQRLRIGYETDPPQPRWMDLEVFPDQVIDLEEETKSSPEARKVELGAGGPGVLRGNDSLAWNLEGAGLRLAAAGMSTDELVAVATSVSVVDERTWARATAAVDVAPPYGFLEPPQLVAEGPGWRAQVGVHRPWLQRRGERLVVTDAATGSGLMLSTQYDSADLLHVGHARSGNTVIALGVGPKGATTFRLTYGDVVVEVDAVVAGSGTPVFAADVGPVETEPTEMAAFDGDGRRITGIVQPPTPLDFGP